jgi:DNA-binding MarR family transcriptional regulator
MFAKYVNMADVISDMHKSAAGPEAEELVELIELLFFAYRDFVSDPDEILGQIGFGRAHHRVVHFVGRNPGMRVSELLDILRITKQSLGRVLRELIEREFVFQREGETDRRQRLLYLTGKGEELRARLLAPQLKRVAQALGEAGPEAEAKYREVLFRLIDATAREDVRRLIAREREQG